MINGKDPKSYEVIKMLNANYSQKDISLQLNISLDNIKRLSRYNNMLSQATEYLSPKALDVIRNLGTKALALSLFFKEKNFRLLESLLLNIPLNIKRSDLSELANAVMGKYKEMEEQKKTLQNELKNVEEDLFISQNKENDLKTLYCNHPIMNLITECDEKTRNFLQDYIGTYNGKPALLRRLHVSWQNYLKNNQIIKYNSTSYVWEIIDIKGLIKSTENRLKYNKPLKFELSNINDYQRERVYKKSPIQGDRYKNVKDVFLGLKMQLDEFEEEIRFKQIKISELESNLTSLKKSPENVVVEILSTPDKRNLTISNKIKNLIINFISTSDFYESIEKDLSIEKMADDIVALIKVELDQYKFNPV